MADGLAEALAGLQASPAQNPYGIASMGLASAAPNLITPYTSPGAAIGIGLGSVLLQSLLGYQAKQSALQDTIQANSLANQMLKMQTPEERTSFLGGLDVSPDIRGRLSTLSTALMQQELASKATIAQQQAKLKQDVTLEAIKQGYIPKEYSNLFALPTSTETPSIALDAVTGQTTIKVPDTIDGVPITPKEKRDLQKKAIEIEMGEQAKAPQVKEDFYNREYTRLKAPGEEYSKVAQQFNSAIELSKQDTIASAQALAKLMVKIPDPTSVVSKAEQNAAADVQDVRRKYSNMIEKLIAGGSGFDQQAYNDMLAAAKTFVDASGKNYNQLAQGSIQRAKKRGFISTEADDMSDFLPVPLYNPSQLAFNKEAASRENMTPKAQALMSIRDQLKATTDPAQIAALKQQARNIMAGQ